MQRITVCAAAASSDVRSSVLILAGGGVAPGVLGLDDASVGVSEVVEKESPRERFAIVECTTASGNLQTGVRL